jgi:hypothetical protein
VSEILYTVKKKQWNCLNNYIKFKDFCLPANKWPVHFLASGPGKVNMVYSLGELNFKKFITFVIGFKVI